ncbi:MAG: phosphatidylglycerol lysyltransferase domain-containing protein [Gemmatimonadales bacterium]
MASLAGSWIAMGDPVGPTPARRELVWRFRELADRAGGHTVFYQVGPEHLGLYIDLGLVLSKLGEEAHVPLAEFTLEGRDRKGLRRTHTALGEREGCTVEIIPPSGVPPRPPQLAAVSTAWLAHHHGREKGFSLGGFDPAYLARLPVAIVRQRGLWLLFPAEPLAGRRPQ